MQNEKKPKAKKMNKKKQKNVKKDKKEKVEEAPDKKQKKKKLALDIGLAIPEFNTPDLRCNRCKNKVDPARCQVTGKSAGCWRCNVCNTRAVQLSRLPEWKTFQKDLAGFGDDEKEEFWQSAGQAVSPAQLSKLISEKMVKRHIESTSKSSGGEYLPLSVLATRGWDVAVIEQQCTDKKPCKMFGWRYCVDTDKKDTTTTDQHEHQKALQASGPPPGSSSEQNPAGGAAAAGAAAEGEDTGAKPKPTDAQIKKDKGTATRILAKLATIMVQMQTTMKSKKLEKLLSFSVEAAKQLLTDLKAMEANAQKVIRGTESLQHTMQSANELVP